MTPHRLHPIPAQHHGLCYGCSQDINPGDLIYIRPGRTYHLHCWEKE